MVSPPPFLLFSLIHFCCGSSPLSLSSNIISITEIHSQSSLPSLFTYFYLHSPPSLSNHLSLSISEGRRREVSGDFQASSDVCLHCSTTPLLSICPLHMRNSKYQQQLIQNRRKHQVFDMKMSTEHAYKAQCTWLSFLCSSY